MHHFLYSSSALSVDVTVVKNNGQEIKNVLAPILSRPWLKVAEKDFFLRVEKVACFRVKDGNTVLIEAHKDSDLDAVQLFLNGSVLGAVLHQSGILPFHGSSFAYHGKGIMICGHSGCGKSSVTAAFCQNNAQFISDDISPVRISKSETVVLPVKDHLKLWDDTLSKLQIEDDELKQVRPELSKFYFPVKKNFTGEHKLDHLFVLGTHNKDEYAVNELNGIAKFDTLRRQIYRKIYLKGMPETERKYFKQIFELAATVRVTRVIRPQICDIYETMRFIENEINQ